MPTFYEFFIKKINEEKNQDVVGGKFEDDQIGWQVRIAIDPTTDKETLLKAYTELAKKFFPDKNNQPLFEFKVHTFNNPSDTESYTNSWDAFFHNFNKENLGASDCQQLGKEVCIYLRYDKKTGKFKQTPQKIKEFLLECWKVLQDSEVILGYVAPNPSDKPLVTSSYIVTPFSVTVATPDGQPENITKPWHRRHAELHKTFPNSGLYGDPLQGVVITPKDLQEKGIKDQTDSIIRTRITFYQNHFKEFEKNFIEYIEIIEQNAERSSFNQSLRDFSLILNNINVDNARKLLAGQKGNLEVIKNLLPRFPDDILTHRSTPSNGGMRWHPSHSNKFTNFVETLDDFFNKDEITEVDLTNLRSAFNELETEIQEEIKLTHKELIGLKDEGHPLLLNVDNTRLSTLLWTDPASVQLIYRKLVHFKHELIAFKNQLRIRDLRGMKDANLGTQITQTPECVNLSNFEVDLSNFETEKNEPPKNILNNRLKVNCESHNSAIVSGSSYANAKTQDKEKGKVLDAASQRYIKDKFGIITGIVATTADGLGHSREAEENQSTINVTSYGCEEFNKRVANQIQSSPNIPINLVELYKSVGQDSKEKAAPMSREQKYDSKSAMVGTVINGDSGRNINVGDVLVVVLDGKTFKPKIQLPARAYYDVIEGKYNPFAIQRLDEQTKNETDPVDQNSFKPEPGDIIIQLTDGLYSSFRQDVEPSNEMITVKRLVKGESKDFTYPLYKEYKLNEFDLPRLLRETFGGISNPSAFEIANFIAHLAFEREYQRRKNFLLIVENLRMHNIINLPTGKSEYREESKFKISLNTWLEKNLAEPKFSALKEAVQGYLDLAAHDDDFSCTDRTEVWEFFETIEKKLLGRGGLEIVQRFKFRKYLFFLMKL